jgi:hypothetical protein
MAYPPFNPVWFRPRPIAMADFVRKTFMSNFSALPHRMGHAMGKRAGF